MVIGFGPAKNPVFLLNTLFAFAVNLLFFSIFDPSIKLLSFFPEQLEPAWRPRN